MEFSVCNVRGFMMLKEYDVKDRKGNTILQWVLKNCDKKTCIEMIDEYNGSLSEGLLRYALIRNDLDIVKSLRRNGFISKEDSLFGICEQTKITEETYKCLRYLLKYGLDPTQYNEDKWTLLHKLVLMRTGADTMENPSTKCVRLLLLYGSDPNDNRNEEGITPLMLAAQNTRTLSSDSILLELLRIGGDPNRKCKNGLTSLMYACNKHTSSIRTLRLLIDFKAGCNIVDDYGENVLMKAIRGYKRQTNRDMILLIMNSGTIMDHRNHKGQSALDLAYKYDIDFDICNAICIYMGMV